MIYVVRHGETNWNLENQTQGSIDIELNETGIKQAKKVKDEFTNIKLDVVLCSTLNRCKSTAKIICEGREVPIIEMKELRERNFGEFEGKQKNIEYDWVEFWNWQTNKQYTKAENIRDFYERIASLMEKIKKEYKEKNILIVTHSGVCAMIYCYFNNIKPDGKLKIPGTTNCGISKYVL